jgi:hypothetical protein
MSADPSVPERIAAIRQSLITRACQGCEGTTDYDGPCYEESPDVPDQWCDPCRAEIAAEVIAHVEAERDEALKAADCPMLMCPYEKRALAAEHALADLQGRIEQVILDMQSSLGPSWPPNFSSGEQVHQWSDELEEAVATAVLAPASPERPDEHVERIT